MAIGSQSTVQSPYSLSSFISFLLNNFAILFVVALFALGGFFTGSLWTENQFLKDGGGSGTKVAQPADDAAAPAAADSGPTADQLKNAPEVQDDEHIRGKKDAKITLVEYSDFECPFCAKFHPTMNQVMQEYGDDVRWVYRHYPLSFHPNAQKAAEASECVTKQGGNDAFWKYADYVFGENEKTGAISAQVIDDGAKAAGVNFDDYKKCLDSGEMAQKVTDSLDAGSSAGISGTPGTILITDDGQYEMISGALPFAQVKTTIDAYLE
jgi:protein-disulfide isomerase